MKMSNICQLLLIPLHKVYNFLIKYNFCKTNFLQTSNFLTLIYVPKKGLKCSIIYKLTLSNMLDNIKFRKEVGYALVDTYPTMFQNFETV